MPELLWWRRIDSETLQSPKVDLSSEGSHWGPMRWSEQQVKDRASWVDLSGQPDGIHGIPEQREKSMGSQSKESAIYDVNAGRRSVTAEQQCVFV